MLPLKTIIEPAYMRTCMCVGVAMTWWTLGSHSNLLYYSRVGEGGVNWFSLLFSAHPVSEQENSETYCMYEYIQCV